MFGTKPTFAFKQLPQLRIRKLLRILFIDDNQVPKADALRGHGYNVFHKSDISSLTEIENDEFHIIFCDIGGVGKSIGAEDEGAGLIRAIKKKVSYPVVIAYSASSYQPGSSHESTMREIADGVILKDAPVGEYVQLLDDWGPKVFSADRCLKILSEMTGRSDVNLRSDILKPKNGASIESSIQGIKNLAEGAKTVLSIIEMLRSVS